MFSSTDESDEGFFWEDIEEYFPPPHVPGTISYPVTIKILPRKSVEEERCPYLDLIHPDLLNSDFMSTDGELSSSGAEGSLNPGISNLSIASKVPQSQSVKKSWDHSHSFSGEKKSGHDSESHRSRSRRHERKKSKRHVSISDSEEDEDTGKSKSKRKSSKMHHKKKYDVREIGTSESSDLDYNEEVFDLRNLIISKAKSSGRKEETISGPSKKRDSEDSRSRYKSSDDLRSRYRDSEDLIEKKLQLPSRSRDLENTSVKKTPVLFKSRDLEVTNQKEQLYPSKPRDSENFSAKKTTSPSTSKVSEEINIKKTPTLSRSKGTEVFSVKKEPGLPITKEPGPPRSRNSEESSVKKIPVLTRSKEPEETIKNVPVPSSQKETEDMTRKNIPVLSRETEDFSKTTLPSLSKNRESESSKQVQSCESVHSNEDTYEDAYEDYDDEYYEGYEENSYYCEPCKATMNSVKSWQAHLSGKRHLKTIKMLDPETAARESVPIKTEAPTSRIPSVSLGYERILTGEISKVQNVVDIVEPICPGLDKVMEIIRAENQYSYYCELCDAICVADTIVKHLMSFRHRLQCMKEYNFHRYEMLRHSKRAVAEPVIISYFQSIEKHYRRAQIRVFRDVPLWSSHPIMPGPSSLSQPFYPVSENPTESTLDLKDYNLPGPSKGNNFHCAVCDCYMNNYAMWQSHIHGKRHLKNIKKKPDERPSKVKYIKSTNPCELLRRIPKNMNICGLDFVLEKMTEVGYVYDCLLCSSHSNSGDIFEHLDNIKHKRKYVEKVNPGKAVCLKNLTAKMSQTNVNALYEDAAREEAETHGIGTPEVYESK